MQLPNPSDITMVPCAEEVEISPNLQAQYIYGKNDRWKLHIIIDDNLTIDELRKAWKSIISARETIFKFQGSDLQLFSNALFYELDQQDQNGVSYGTLVYDISFDALVFLLCAVDTTRDENSRRIGLICLYNLFNAVGFKTDVKTWVESGIENLQNGQIPWRFKDGIISREELITIIRSIRTAKANEKLIFKPGLDSQYLHSIWMWFLTHKYWMDAEKMLKKALPKEFNKYSKRLKQRTLSLMSEICRLNPGVAPIDNSVTDWTQNEDEDLLTKFNKPKFKPIRGID